MSKRKLGKHFEDLSEDAKDYIKSEIEYYKLDAYKKLIKSISFFLRFVVKVGIIVTLFAFLSIGLAFFLGEFFNHNYIGFFIVAGIYLITFIFIMLFGKPYFDNKVLKIFNNIFKDI
jgi:lipopolysaccharide export LptBFGC system permease protein LptF